MNNYIKELVKKFLEHKVDTLIIFIFVLIGFFLYLEYDKKPETNNSHILMPIVVLTGLFLAWLQFISNKSRQRKEAALTYYPRPMELEKVENDIDMVINFWSSHYAMASHEVKLMLDEDITSIEYELCWERLSEQIKREIVDVFSKYYSIDKNHVFNFNKLSYREEYNVLIKEKFVSVRRKFNLYLNQIEGFCLALNKGNIDSDTAKSMYVHKLENHFRKAKPYIDALRIKKNTPEIYIEFEKVVYKWKR